ncbi:MAG: sigma-70 family RNA polymerase sigma factor, partial [Candidatus Neomicrothrix subdominans]
RPPNPVESIGTNDRHCRYRTGQDATHERAWDARSGVAAPEKFEDLVVRCWMLVRGNVVEIATTGLDAVPREQVRRTVNVESDELVRSVEAIFRDRYREFVALAAVMLAGWSDAEEVVQDAFAAVLRRGPRLRDLDDLGGYVAQAVVNGARSQLRKRSVEARPHAIAAVPNTASVEGNSAFFDLVLRLPERQAQSLICRYALDLSIAETARVLGISATTVKTHLRRGLPQLASWLEESHEV